MDLTKLNMPEYYYQLWTYFLTVHNFHFQILHKPQTLHQKKRHLNRSNQQVQLLDE